MNYVVDTNVAIAANGENTHADIGCQYACVVFLQSLAKHGSRDAVAIDSLELILREYQLHLSYSGQPGVGDMFFKFIHDNMYSNGVIGVFDINPTSDDNQGFLELPINALDRSDRKFLAVAVISGATIANALDTDWLEQEPLLHGLGISVRQLCPQHM